MVRFCENGNEHSAAIKLTNFLTSLVTVIFLWITLYYGGSVNYILWNETRQCLWALIRKVIGRK